MRFFNEKGCCVFGQIFLCRAYNIMMRTPYRDAANFQLQDTQKSSVMEASTMGASTSYAHLFGNIMYWCGEPFCSL